MSNSLPQEVIDSEWFSTAQEIGLGSQYAIDGMYYWKWMFAMGEKPQAMNSRIPRCSEECLFAPDGTIRGRSIEELDRAYWDCKGVGDDVRGCPEFDVSEDMVSNDFRETLETWDDLLIMMNTVLDVAEEEGALPTINDRDSYAQRREKVRKLAEKYKWDEIIAVYDEGTPPKEAVKKVLGR